MEGPQGLRASELRLRAMHVPVLAGSVSHAPFGARSCLARIWRRLLFQEASARESSQVTHCAADSEPTAPQSRQDRQGTEVRLVVCGLMHLGSGELCSKA